MRKKKTIEVPKTLVPGRVPTRNVIWRVGRNSFDQLGKAGDESIHTALGYRRSVRGTKLKQDIQLDFTER